MRRQLPVHSPITLGSLAAGLRTAASSKPDSSPETLIRDHWSAHAVVLTDSGTSALSLAISASVRSNGVVALPAYACYDLATAADGANARVVLYDVDPGTLAPEPASLRGAITRGAEAVVAVHLYGLPIDMDAIKEIAGAAGVPVIEDAAQAIGASWRGVPAGGHGTFGVLSFGRGKGLNAGGGGALLLHDADAASRFEKVGFQMRAAQSGYGAWLRSCAQWLVGRPAVYGIPAALPFLRLGETIYHRAEAPQPMSKASRGMLREVWQRSHAAVAIRRVHADRLLNIARKAGGWRVINVEQAAQPSYLRLPLLADGRARAAVLSAASARLGVMPGYPLPLSRLPDFGDRCINPNEQFPGAERLARDLLTLPTHELLSSADLARLETWLTQ